MTFNILIPKGFGKVDGKKALEEMMKETPVQSSTPQSEPVLRTYPSSTPSTPAVPVKDRTTDLIVYSIILPCFLLGAWSIASNAYKIYRLENPRQSTFNSASMNSMPFDDRKQQSPTNNTSGVYRAK